MNFIFFVYSTWVSNNVEGSYRQCYVNYGYQLVCLFLIVYLTLHVNIILGGISGTIRGTVGFNLVSWTTCHLIPNYHMSARCRTKENPWYIEDPPNPHKVVAAVQGGTYSTVNILLQHFQCMCTSPSVYCQLFVHYINTMNIFD